MELRQRTFAWLAGLGVAVAIGCGGGGGGGTGPAPSSLADTCPIGSDVGDLEYTTVWSNAPVNASQFVRLVDAAGSVVRSFSVPRASGATFTTVEQPSLSAGVYELRAELYGLPLAGGDLLGVSSQVVAVCGGLSRARTEIGGASALTLVPESFEGTEQSTLRFVATPRGGNGTPTFVDPGEISFAVTGGVGTVSSDGSFEAAQAGTGTLTASMTSPALSASSDVRVGAFDATRGKWTVLVYLNAANDLYPWSDTNVEMMERVASNPDVRFVVQWKQTREVWQNSSFDGVRRYLVQDRPEAGVQSVPVQSNLVDDQGRALDMGDPQTLADFVEWGKQFYPADRYVLVIWNHGNGWRRSVDDHDPTRAFSYDDQYGTSIQAWEMDEALDGHRFDILAWDASLMQMLEVATESEDYADYIVGSEESPPAEGYPYDSIFAAFRDRPDDPTSTLTRSFVDGMVNHPPYATRKITQSSLDTSKLAAVRTAVDALGQELIDHRSAIADDIPDVRFEVQSYSRTSQRFFVDLVDLCFKLEALTSAPGELKDAAAAVRAAVNAAVVHEGNNENSPNSHGLSIDFSPADTFEFRRFDYQQLQLAQETSWDEWLRQAP